MTQNCKYNLPANHNHLFRKYRLKFQSIPGDFDLRPLKCPWLPGADKKPRCSYSLVMFGKYWTVLRAHKDRQISPHRSKTAASWSHGHFMVLSQRPLVSFPALRATTGSITMLPKSSLGPSHHPNSIKRCLKTPAPATASVMERGLSQKKSQRSLRSDLVVSLLCSNQ